MLCKLCSNPNLDKLYELCKIPIITNEKFTDIEKDLTLFNCSTCNLLQNNLEEQKIDYSYIYNYIDKLKLNYELIMQYGNYPYRSDGKMVFQFPKRDRTLNINERKLFLCLEFIPDFENINKFLGKEDLLIFAYPVTDFHIENTKLYPAFFTQDNFKYIASIYNFTYDYKYDKDWHIVLFRKTNIKQQISENKDKSFLEELLPEVWEPIISGFLEAQKSVIYISLKEILPLSLAYGDKKITAINCIIDLEDDSLITDERYIFGIPIKNLNYLRENIPDYFFMFDNKFTFTKEFANIKILRYENGSFTFYPRENIIISHPNNIGLCISHNEINNTVYFCGKDFKCNFDDYNEVRNLFVLIKPNKFYHTNGEFMHTKNICRAIKELNLQTKLIQKIDHTVFSGLGKGHIIVHEYTSNFMPYDDNAISNAASYWIVRHYREKYNLPFYTCVTFDNNENYELLLSCKDTDLLVTENCARDYVSYDDLGLGMVLCSFGLPRNYVLSSGLFYTDKQILEKLGKRTKIKEIDKKSCMVVGGLDSFLYKIWKPEFTFGS